MTGAHSGPPEREGHADAGADREALERLDARIVAAREKLNPAPKRTARKYQALTLAWRMVLELVIGCALGAAIGFGLDEAFGTKPLMIVVFGGLGLAAGIKTMLASAREVSEAGERRQDAVNEGSDRGEH